MRRFLAVLILAAGLGASACGGMEDAASDTTTERSPIVISGTTYTQDPVSGYYRLPAYGIQTTGGQCLYNCWQVPAGLFMFRLHPTRTSPWYAVNYWENGDIQASVTEPSGTAYSCTYYSPNPNAVAPGSPGPDYADWRSNAQVRWQCSIPTGAVWQFDCHQPSQFANVTYCNIHRHWPAPNYSIVDEAFNVPVSIARLTPIPVQ